MKKLMTSLLILSSPAICLAGGEKGEANTSDPAHVRAQPQPQPQLQPPAQHTVAVAAAPKDVLLEEERPVVVTTTSTADPVVAVAKPRNIHLVLRLLNGAAAKERDRQAALLREKAALESRDTNASTAGSEDGTQLAEKAAQEAEKARVAAAETFNSGIELVQEETKGKQSTSVSTTAPVMAEDEDLGEVSEDLRGRLPSDWTAAGYLSLNPTYRNLFGRPRPGGWSDADVLANHYIKWGAGSRRPYKVIDTFEEALRIIEELRESNAQLTQQNSAKRRTIEDRLKRNAAREGGHVLDAVAKVLDNVGDATKKGGKKVKKMKKQVKRLGKKKKKKKKKNKKY